MRKVIALLLAGSACCAVAAAPGDATTTLSPPMQQAIHDMSAGDAQTRDDGLKNFETATATQTRALITSDDPETQSRVAGLLQFNARLSMWILETLKLPAEQADAQINFCLRADVLPKIAAIFLEEPEKRQQGVAALAKFSEPEAGTMLLGLMDDPDESVHLAALQGIAVRKPTAAIVDSLWQHAVEEELHVLNSPLAVRGKEPAGYFDEALCDQCCTVLITMKSPAVEEKLQSLLQRVEDYYAKPDKRQGLPWVFDDRQPPMKNAFRLLKAYHPKGAYPILFAIATGKAYQGASIAYDANNMPIMLKQPGGRNVAGPAVADDAQKKLIKSSYYWSTRTLFIKLFVEMTNQNLDDYQVKPCRNMGGIWTVPTAEDEDKAVAKLKEWWTDHSKDYEEAPASQPAARASWP